MTASEPLGLSPINFFHVSGTCRYVEKKLPLIGTAACKKYLLGDTSALTDEEAFAKVALGWNEEGIAIQAVIDQPPIRSLFPEVVRGDSLEVFIDTRDVKASGFNTRFCHHFFALAEPVGGKQAGEITRFRTDEDRHPLCNPNDLKISCDIGSKSYTLHLFIPAHCLMGYDPEQFQRIGFSYRINRPDSPSQHFTAITQEYRIEEQPSLWSSLQLSR
ncbi:MAG: hypothetical protein H7A37_10090 [Chlamydiales bacterium]|nr:hypothetical protein [Chlamydiales bacterium]